MKLKQNGDGFRYDSKRNSVQVFFRRNFNENLGSKEEGRLQIWRKTQKEHKTTQMAWAFHSQPLLTMCSMLNLYLHASIGRQVPDPTCLCYSPRAVLAWKLSTVWNPVEPDIHPCVKPANAEEEKKSSCKFNYFDFPSYKCFSFRALARWNCVFCEIFPTIDGWKTTKKWRISFYFPFFIFVLENRSQKSWWNFAAQWTSNRIQ